MGPTDKNATPESRSSCSTIVDSGTYDQLIFRGHKLQSFSSLDEENAPNSAEPHALEWSEHRDIDEIRVVGGYKVMTNDTDCSCHADPESHHVDVQNNPDLIAERIIPKEFDAKIENEMITYDGVEQKANSTEVSTVPKISTRTGGLVSTDDKMTTKAVPLSTYIGYFQGNWQSVSRYWNACIVHGRRWSEVFPIIHRVKVDGNGRVRRDVCCPRDPIPQQSGIRSGSRFGLPLAEVILDHAGWSACFQILPSENAVFRLSSPNVIL